MQFAVNSLQGEPATIGTILRANAVLKEFLADCDFELCFNWGVVKDIVLLWGYV